MDGQRSFAKELTGRMILIAAAALILLVKWWLPLVAAPLCWQIWDTAFGRSSHILNPASKLIADVITWIVWLAYIVYSIIGFGLNIGRWYGWLIGIIVGLVVAQFLGLLWPHRWHIETVERNL